MGPARRDLTSLGGGCRSPGARRFRGGYGALLRGAGTRRLHRGPSSHDGSRRNCLQLGDRWTNDTDDLARLRLPSPLTVGASSTSWPRGHQHFRALGDRVVFRILMTSKKRHKSEQTECEKSRFEKCQVSGKFRTQN